MTPAVSCQSLTKSFGNHFALHHINLDIPQGSIVGLLGKNGSGKTTMLKCMLGLLKPAGGSCRLLGEDSWNLSAAAKERIGYVPQVVNFYKWMRAEDVIAYTASFYKRWNERLAWKIATEFEIPMETRVSALSVGQLQKLAIVTAVGHEPDLLILDEPVASLDPIARRQFLQMVVDLAEPQKRTILFSTHILSDMERIVDRVVILKTGKIIHDGSLDDLKDETHLNLEEMFLELHHA